MSGMEIMWFREYIHYKESLNRDDTEASREKKLEIILPGNKIEKKSKAAP
jgi:hypothetical protein